MEFETLDLYESDFDLLFGSVMDFLAGNDTNNGQNNNTQQHDPDNDQNTNNQQPGPSVSPHSTSLSESKCNDEGAENSNKSKAPTFIEVSDQQTDEFVKSMRNKNTIRKTENAIKQFEKWLQAAPRNEKTPCFEMQPCVLDNYIGSFILSIRKSDGSDYEPDTLTSYQRGIDRYLRENKYPHSIINDKEFEASRAVLVSKRKELKAKGKGNRPNAAEPVSANEETILKEKGAMGLNSPKQLLNQIWYNNTVLFGMRGGLENRELKWGDISLKKNEEGTEYLEMSERVTKTRTGETSKRQRPFKPKQFAHKTQSNDCPVTAYKKYASHRPLKMDFPEAPFYLAINHFRKVETDWFKCQPLGEHKLSSLMRTMYEKADIPGRKTNHSARKTCTKLLHAGVAPTVIQQLTGHQKVQSINNYAKPSNETQHNMSDILSGHKENLTHLCPCPYPRQFQLKMPQFLVAISEAAFLNLTQRCLTTFCSMPDS